MPTTYPYTNLTALVFEPTVDGAGKPILHLVTAAGTQTLGDGDIVIDIVTTVDIDNVDIQFKDSATHEFHVTSSGPFTWLRRPATPILSYSVRQVPTAVEGVNAVDLWVSSKLKSTGVTVAMAHSQVILIKRRPPL